MVIVVVVAVMVVMVVVTNRKRLLSRSVDSTLLVNPYFARPIPGVELTCCYFRPNNTFLLDDVLGIKMAKEVGNPAIRVHSPRVDWLLRDVALLPLIALLFTTAAQLHPLPRHLLRKRSAIASLLDENLAP